MVLKFIIDIIRRVGHFESKLKYIDVTDGCIVRDSWSFGVYRLIEKDDVESAHERLFIQYSIEHHSLN